jgi:hypothetical protein
MEEDDNVMNQAEDQHILATHQARVGRVNRTQWQYDSPELEIDVLIADPPPTFAVRARHRLGSLLIHAGERLLPPATRLADGGPC